MSKETETVLDYVAVPATDWLSEVIDLRDVRDFSYEYDVYSDTSGAVAGSLKLMGSLDGQNYKELSSVTLAADANEIQREENFGVPFLRFRWEDTGSVDLIIGLKLCLDKK